ncbi:TNF receptor-associated factor 4-like [Dysidea avara]|uniref:TNF receptor-associated factor 4-like n=1 Tax=Dysidea avara TaxID=196820 RepID=UPI0033266E7E
MCRNEEFSSVLNKQIDREVKELTVHCTNSRAGCAWRGELRALSTHRRICNYEVIQCDYYGIGCIQKGYRMVMQDHNKEKAEEHLALGMLKLRSMERFIYQTMMGSVVKNWSMQLGSLSEMSARSCDLVCPVIVKVSAFISKKRDDERWNSNSFYSHDKGYKMRLRVYPAGIEGGRGTHLSVFLFLLKGPHDDELTWPLRGEFEFKLLNQIRDREHYSGTMVYGDLTSNSNAERVDDGGRVYGHGFQLISNEDLLDDTRTCQYLKDDCIFLQVSKL